MNTGALCAPGVDGAGALYAPGTRKEKKMKITLPDGSNKELEQGATVAEVAASIGAGLAKAALAGKTVIKEIYVKGKLYNIVAK